MLCYDALQATHKHTERLGFGLTHYWCHETKVLKVRWQTNRNEHAINIDRYKYKELQLQFLHLNQTKFL